MSCACGKSYIIQPNDTFFIIAKRELGNGNRWQKIMKLDCTPVTEVDASQLQPGDEFCLPNGVSPPPRSSGFADFVSRATTNRGRVPGFGMTINIINGGLECSIPTNDIRDRVGFTNVFARC